MSARSALESNVVARKHRCQLLYCHHDNLESPPRGPEGSALSGDRRGAGRRRRRRRSRGGQPPADPPRPGRPTGRHRGHRQPRVRRGRPARARLGRGRARHLRPRSDRPGAGEDEDSGVVDLGQNHPPDPATQPQRRALLAALAGLTARADAARLLDYPAAGGNPQDREAGAEWVARAGVAAAARRRDRLHGKPARPHGGAGHAARAGRPAPRRVADLRGRRGRRRPPAPPPAGAARSTRTACGPTPSRTPAGAARRRPST